jgi:HEPN domain-containing protein
LINRRMARDYLLRATRCPEEAELALSKQDYAGTVRRSQEALESALRALSIEYPKEHDVSEALLNERDRLPRELQEGLEDLAALSRELASLRGPAMYGYEKEGIPPSGAFSARYAESTLAKVRVHVTKLVELLSPLL